MINHNHECITDTEPLLNSSSDKETQQTDWWWVKYCSVSLCGYLPLAALWSNVFDFSRVHFCFVCVVVQHTSVQVTQDIFLLLFSTSILRLFTAGCGSSVCKGSEEDCQLANRNMKGDFTRKESPHGTGREGSTDGRKSFRKHDLKVAALYVGFAQVWRSNVCRLFPHGPFCHALHNHFCPCQRAQTRSAPWMPSRRERQCKAATTGPWRRLSPRPSVPIRNIHKPQANQEKWKLCSKQTPHSFQ